MGIKTHWLLKFVSGGLSVKDKLRWEDDALTERPEEAVVGLAK